MLEALILNSNLFLFRIFLIQFLIALAQATTTTNQALTSNIVGLWSNAGGLTVAVTAVVLAATILYTQRGRIKSPWSHRKSRLSPEQWRSLFTEDGKICDGGVMLLKKVRSGGIDPSIRAEVWQFLLGLFDLNSTKYERATVLHQKRKDYEKLRKKCRQLLKSIEISNANCAKIMENGSCANPDEDPASVENVDSSMQTSNIEEKNSDNKPICMTPTADGSVSIQKKEVDDSEVGIDKDSSNVENVDSSMQTSNSEEKNSDIDVRDSKPTCVTPAAEDSDSVQKKEVAESEVGAGKNSSSVDSPEDSDEVQDLPTRQNGEESIQDKPSQHTSSISKTEIRPKLRESEDFTTWQRIIRLDAVRANAEWVDYAPSLATVSITSARQSAEAVGLMDYDHLEPFRIFHAARLVAILEAYAVYDPEIGYCQGMSDLLSPLITVIKDDVVAFWCFVGFMRKARHNFRLDELGIRRQLNIVSKIIKSKDPYLFNHLSQLQVEDCFFVYRMVVVLFRRELNFEQTLSLWEVMWADQTAIRAGIGKSAWSRIRLRAPPTEDLLLYAIAASVLQRRKLIIERYSSMEDIIRECNNMAGHLDVWKLLDDAHNLVMSLHEKIETS